MCDHHNRVGDNYGVSCMDCGEQLAGYGYGGWFGQRLTHPKKCIHFWGEYSDVCIYCEQPRQNLEQRVSGLEEQIRRILEVVPSAGKRTE